MTTPEVEMTQTEDVERKWFFLCELSVLRGEKPLDAVNDRRLRDTHHFTPS